ncbi:ABC transporter substrate-binding protein [Clostridium sporogenes]|uniref:Putative ABC transporter, substrate-binding protein n=1 Tax=Clostridium sporogenes TaxID=1509 RepID=A0A7U4JMI5_CLOSG|nr:ABC transporter substrate-binding protein [Clostridium sporogenes]AVP59705.1 ABC transporter substrate-binding protein [Clostridium botulinum]AKC61882.1 putative ABC transporter, substrate-binding protein [Clostridium sporogenes]AKJ89188.1 ABC transporter substrate-binding protein [Clostridium sporogenes]KCZ69189.1 putative ABC transporter, substrate-binding protein [Clostridium sporogenes]MBA4510278.1 ABC transporter substrate-binding protein [Clostridium sporogenes]
MVVKRKISILLALILSVAIFGGCSKISSSKKLKDKKVINIGIAQIIEHPALDLAKKGFVDRLAEKGFKDGKNIKIDFQNAQGDMATIQTITQNFVAQKNDIIYAIATPSVQAAFNATKKIPIVMTAITDPVESGVVKSLDKSGTNVAGTSDKISIEENFKLMKDILPGKKTIGILYNTSEKNSEIQVKEAEEKAKKFGFKIVKKGITNVNDIHQSLASILNEIDIMFIPTDNTVASSMPFISNECNKKNIPIIGSEKAHVEGGALATSGIDYYKLGKESADVAIEIINGKNPKDMKVKFMKETKLSINLDAAKKLNIKIPKDIEDKAEKVKGGKK